MGRGKDELLNPEREAAKRRFLTEHGLASARLEPLAGDASTRSYARLHPASGPVLILMDQPPVLETPVCPPGASDAERIALGYNASARLAAGSIAAFVTTAAYLRDHGLSAPKIAAFDVGQGFAVLEDLGDGLFATLIADGQPEAPLYEAAVDVQVRLHEQRPPDILRASEYRAADIAQHVAKGRDLVQSVVGDYVRLRREVETNRCNDAVPRRYQNVIIGPLESVLAGEQKAAEDSITAFREPLKEGQRPPDAATAAAKSTLDTLIRRLEQVRRELGDTLSEGKLREDLRKIIENQVVVSKAIEGISRKGRERLFAPEVRPVPPIVLAPGESRKITHEVDWKLFDKGELKLRLEVTAGSEVVVPAEVIAKDDRNDFDYTVTAGKKPGVYALKIVPSVGPALEIALTVK